jgi:hypothetical protein
MNAVFETLNKCMANVSDDVEVEAEVRMWLRVSAHGKVTGQVYQYLRACREIKVFCLPGSNIACLAFYIYL